MPGVQQIEMPIGEDQRRIVFEPRLTRADRLIERPKVADRRGNRWLMGHGVATVATAVNVVADVAPIAVAAAVAATDVFNGICVTTGGRRPCG